MIDRSASSSSVFSPEFCEKHSSLKKSGTVGGPIKKLGPFWVIGEKVS